MVVLIMKGLLVVEHLAVGTVEQISMWTVFRNSNSAWIRAQFSLTVQMTAQSVNLTVAETVLGLWDPNIAQELRGFALWVLEWGNLHQTTQSEVWRPQPRHHPGTDQRLGTLDLIPAQLCQNRQVIYMHNKVGEALAYTYWFGSCLQFSV